MVLQPRALAQFPEGLLNLAMAICNLRLVAQFWLRFRQLPNIANPASLHEKYLWRKIVDRDPRFVCYSDKLLVKSYMAKQFPQVRCAKVLWTGVDIRTAPRDLIGGHGFLKANHASGTNHRLNGEQPNMPALHNKTQSWLRRRWHKLFGEWGYKQVEPVLFIEEDLVRLGDGSKPVDMTIYVFGGKVTHVAAMTEHKSDDVAFARFDDKGRRLALGEYPSKRMERLARGRNAGAPNTLPDDFELPRGTAQIMELAKDIGATSDHLRVDFLWNGRGFFLTEITLYSQGGFVLYSDQGLLNRMAEAWDLQASWLLSTKQSGWRNFYASWLQEKLTQPPPAPGGPRKSSRR